MKRFYRRVILAALLVFAAALRIYWVCQPRVVWGDETFYLWVGQSLLDGSGYQFFGFSGSHFSPLFPVAAALIARLASGFTTNATQALIVGSGAVYVISGTLLLLPVYGIARRVGGAGPALAAALVTAVYPMLTVGALFWSTGTEMLYLCLLATAWWGLLVALQDDRLWGYALAGAMIGLAYLVRTEGIVYLVAGAGVVSLLRLGSLPQDTPHLRSERTLAHPTPTRLTGLLPDISARWHWAGRCSRALAAAGILLGVFFLMISPYLIAQWAETGQFQLTEEAGFAYTSMEGLAEQNVALFDRATWGLDPPSGEVYLFAPVSTQQGFLDAITADPMGFARRLRVNLITLLGTAFSTRLIPWPLVALAFLGLFSRPWDARRLRGELLLVAFLAGPLSFLLFDVQARYLVGLLLPALVWIGEGAAQLGGWLAETSAECGMRNANHKWPFRIPHSALRVLPVLLLSAVLLWQTPRVWTMLHRTHSFQPGHLTAAAELQAHGGSTAAVVMSRYPAIAFHAGTRWAPTPNAAWPEVAAYARQHEARYLVMDAWEGQLRPQLSFLLDPANAPGDLRYLATVDGGAGPMVIYEFIGGL